MRLATPLRRAALAFCAILLLVAAVVFSRRMETTTQVKSPAPAASNKPQAAGPTPATAQDTMANPSSSVVAPTPGTALATSANTTLPAASPATSALDLAQLRSRALVIPVQQIKASQLQDTYTQARAGGAPHDALDIMALRGTPVLAVEDGRVAKLFFSKAGGITLYQFDPDSQYAYYYAHLDSYAVGIMEGAAVVKGQVLGYVGSSGNALPGAPHLHFAIFRLGPERQWWRGTPLNPYLVWRDATP